MLWKNGQKVETSVSPDPEIDVQKIAVDLIREYEMRALEWKSRADGVRLLFTKLTEVGSAGSSAEKQDSNKLTK